MAHKNERRSEETGRGMVGAGVESPGAKPTQLTELPRASHNWPMMLNLKAFFVLFLFCFVFGSSKMI